jgi:hypothetical protein
LSLSDAIGRFRFDDWINFCDFFNSTALLWVSDAVVSIGFSSFEVYRPEVRRGKPLLCLFCMYD